MKYIEMQYPTRQDMKNEIARLNTEICKIQNDWRVTVVKARQAEAKEIYDILITGESLDVITKRF